MAKPMIHIQALGSKNNSENRVWKKKIAFFPPFPHLNNSQLRSWLWGGHGYLGS